MPDAMETILRLVAERAVTPEEAETLLAAIASRDAGRHGTAGAEGQGQEAPTGPDVADPHTPVAGERGGRGERPAGRSRAERLLHIEVVRRGGRAVNLRIPLGLAGIAASLVPGLSAEHLARVREAIDLGLTGPIVEVDEDGEHVVIATE